MSVRPPRDPREGRIARARFAAACGFDAHCLVCGQQVHGVCVVRVRERDRGRGAVDWETAFPSTDALITDVPGMPLAVLVADCVPVFLVDPVRRAVGIVHAGRRGTLGYIAGRTVAEMANAFASNPGDIHAVIGPSAGPERYEVSAGLADAWRSEGLPASGRYLNLWEANARHLESAGVCRTHIAIAGFCTIADLRFFSHRRGDTGRNLAIVSL